MLKPQIVFTRFIGLTIVAFTALQTSPCWAWGERGHHITGYTAAQLTDIHLTPTEKEDIGLFFLVRKIMMGHLNNIPDTQWKDSRVPMIKKLNGPTHYFDAELIVGLPDEDFTVYQNKIRQLDTDFSRFLALYNNKPSPIKNSKSKNLNLFADIGVAPFRIEQLYNKMVAAFKCAAGKKSSKTNKSFSEPIKNGDYKCSGKTTRDEDLVAAVEIGGVMGHFIADLAQPYHTTVDYDGFSTGQGGAHAYFESYVLHYLDEKILDEVHQKTHSSDFQNEAWSALKLPMSDSFHPTKIAFHLLADSQAYLKTAIEIDKKYAILSLGDKIPFGTIMKNPGKEATRRPAHDPAVLNGFRTLATDRLALGALVLSRLWVQAWREGGRPKTKDVSHFSYPYPLKVPFILPQEIFIKETFKPHEQKVLIKELGH